MVEFDLPETFTEEFLALIPRQRYVINTMLAQGAIKSYSLAIDRSRLWAVMLAESEFEVLENIAQMPISNHITPYVSELMFHNAADSVMQFSLN
ncbi:MAG: hypothetical protein H6557_22245 [Lewinellaceae bacterium]|nr:hypothetical protein [Phaeodactylibacter sp.]MCB9039345.1 hypothetical protein [Lewinellaceae bacterium]